MGDVQFWAWDFDNDGEIDSSEQNPWYSYDEVGTYSVSLTVSDSINIDTEIKYDYIEVINVNINDDLIANTILYNNYPNPFNPETVISFYLKTQSEVTLEIFNVRSQKIKTIFYNNLNPGKHELTWYGKDDSGKEVSSGIYFYKMKTNDYQKCNKMILLK